MTVSLSNPPPGADARRCALSLPQERLWLVDQLAESTSAYNVPIAFRLVGRLNVDALQRALNAIVARHDALRASFLNVNGDPIQVIADCVRVPVELESVESRPPAEREPEALRLARCSASQPFNLRQPPLVRVLLVRLADDDHLLVLTFHHIVFDGWSLGPLYRELETFYAGGGDVEPLPLQYADFADWQRTQDHSSTAAYWRAALADAQPPPALAAHGEERPSLRPRAGSRVRQIAPPVADALARFCRQRGTTPFAVHLAAFGAWVAQRTGRDDVIVGVPMAGRTIAETQSLIGFFVNSLPLRLRIPAGVSFAELVARLRGVILDAFAHQEMTAAMVREVVPVGAERRAASLIPVGFAYEPAVAPPVLPGLRVTEVRVDGDAPLDDFTLFVRAKGGAVDARALYSAERFDAAAIDRALEEYAALLGSALRSPDENVATLRAAADIPAGRLLDGRPAEEDRAPRAPAKASVARRDRRTDRDPRSNLTIAQAAMWTAQVMYPGVPVASITTSVRISGPLDVPAFVRAFRRLVASTDALRMVIREQDGVPMQVENEACEASVDVVDMTGAADEDVERWLLKRCSASLDVSKRSFDTALLSLGPSEHVWFLHQHHLFGDGWSSMMIRDRLSRFYLQEIGQPQAIAERFPRWQDVAQQVWAYQASADGAADRGHLARLVTEDVEPIEFFGVPRRQHTTAVSRRQFSLDEAEAGALQRRAAEGSNAGWDAANFFLIGAVLAAYLHRLSGRRTVSFGAPYHNRRARGDRQAAAALKRTCGLFMDVLPVVVDVDANDSFARLIDKVSAAWTAASSHAAGGTPPEVRRRACDVLLNYLPPMPEQLFGLSTRITWVHPGHEIESLSIGVRERQNPEGLEFLFDFHADVFADSARPVVMTQFRRMLDACVEDPSRAVGDVELLSEAERQQVLGQWNQTRVRATTDRTVLESFDEQVEASGGAIALEDDGESVTYEELQDRSRRVSEAFIGRGAGAETLIALCIPRSSAQIAALLGVLRAGAAYLPLDPSLPDERLEAVLSEGGTSLVVTTRALRSREPLRAREAVAIEELLAATEAPSSGKRARPISGGPTNSSRGASPGSLAYVIYTSGSTGTPKGVEVTNGSLANFASFVRSYFRIGPSDRVLQFASLGFDAAAEEIVPALSAGATLVLRSDRMLDSVDEFLDGCARRSITVLDLPTAYWHTIVDVAASRRDFPSTVRAVILGGEAIRPDMLARWRDWVGTRVALFNGYGPTETTVCATYADLTAAVEPAQGPVSIGRPIWNARAYVLDASRHPVAPGFAGELYVGGLGVARGYRNAPALTAASFVPDPWHPGERLYRTGDRVRWRPTGELEYLGRLDGQVKVRGYRVEPAEIEARLQTHPAVREAAVIAEGRDADTRLVAYVGAGRGTTTAAELRDFLAARLPAYMVPSALVVLDSLPRSTSGKVDRRALPAPPSEAGDGSRAPRSDAERAIAAIWSELLGVSAVGVDENFFDLGGHSLLGTRVVARIADALGVSVPLWMLFEHPTVAGLAAAITEAAGSTAAPVLQPAGGGVRRGARTITRVKRGQTE